MQPAFAAQHLLPEVWTVVPDHVDFFGLDQEHGGVLVLDANVQHLGAKVQLVRSMKGVLGQMIRKPRSDLVKHDWKGMLWSPSYFVASCGGAPLDII